MHLLMENNLVVKMIKIIVFEIIAEIGKKIYKK